MKTNLENLTSLLCECEKVNLQVKELKFGCKLLIDDYIHRITDISDYGVIQTDNFATSYKFEHLRVDKIIGNPIEYHHLMMYCENNGIKLSINNYNTTQSGIFFNGNGCCVLDSLKPLHQQSEETLGQIYNFLKGYLGQKN